MSTEYEYLNESSIDDNLKCSICNDPFEKPYISPCDHTFCYKCIEQWITINRSCPTCRYRLSTIENLTPVKTRLISNMLDSLLVKCKNCNKKGIERAHFKDHLKSCRKGKHCPCSAADIRCPWIGRADQLSLHLKQCPYEQIRPIITEILRENRYLKEQSSQLLDRYENEMKKFSNTEEIRKENQRLKQQIHQLNKQLENDNNKQLSNEVATRPITFESLLRENKLGTVPNGYAGLNWINVRYTNEVNAQAIRSLKRQERLSIFARGNSCVAYNDWKNPMVISSIKPTFILHACEITLVNHSEEISKLNIVARKDKKPVYSRIIPLKYNVSKVIEFQPWININEIEFYVQNSYFILTWIHLE